jgi:hypothetical protein
MTFGIAHDRHHFESAHAQRFLGGVQFDEFEEIPSLEAGRTGDPNSVSDTQSVPLVKL